MASKFERYFFALGKATRAVRESAQGRIAAETPADVPANGTPQPPVAIDLIRCPRCGRFNPAGTVCSCT